jgi:hypothetical protein
MSASQPERRPDLQRGDHIRAGWPRQPHHDGIYLGNGRVIHLVGAPGEGKRGAHVQIGTLEDFAAGRPVTVRRYAGKSDPEAIIARAMSKLGDGDYNLVFNNCQHFARWCVTGDHVSEQVEATAAAVGASATPMVAAPIGISVVGSVGFVKGLGGPGIMSGLARSGATIGGGAVEGIMVLGIVPTLVTIAILATALREDEDLPGAERTARAAGRVGLAVGALAGSAGSIAAVNALGVPGLSGAGISSGLAALGAKVGGGMTRGTVCTIVLPAIAAALIGYAAYKLVLHWETTHPLLDSEDTAGR